MARLMVTNGLSLRWTPMAVPRTLMISTRALVALALLAGCSDGGTGSGTRSIVVLSADKNVEIVLPDDAFTNDVVVTTTTTKVLVRAN